MDPYQDKVRLLLDNHIALWDVCESCYRAGSSDRSIVIDNADKKMVFNDIVGLLNKAKKINKIICNGRIAYELLQEYKRSQSDGAFPDIPILCAPSTSPANVDNYTKEDLVKVWEIMLNKNHGSIINSLSPICDSESTVLILGSAPGARSLKTGVYYSGRGNRFWEVKEKVFGCKVCHSDPGFGTASAYAKKELLNLQIALWDVCESCKRKGSSDESIERIRFNDITGLLHCYGKIKGIICNGHKAYDLLKEYIGAQYRSFPDIPIVYAPSTSPRNIVYAGDKLIYAWRKAAQECGYYKTLP